MYSNAFSARSPISEDGRRRRNLRSCVRTEADPSRIRGRSFGRRTEVGSGIGALTGWEESWVVRYANASRRCVSDFEEDARDR